MALRDTINKNKRFTEEGIKFVSVKVYDLIWAHQRNIFGFTMY
jgi:hypothetical protein